MGTIANFEDCFFPHDSITNFNFALTNCNFQDYDEPIYYYLTIASTSFLYFFIQDWSKTGMDPLNCFLLLSLNCYQSHLFPFNGEIDNN